MKVGSMFAGIGGFDLGFKRAGFEVAWCIEWDKAAQAVLRKRFPEATIYGDIREVDPEQLEKVDVICGGFPCQDLSVAGKRKGLAGERSGLFHDAMRLVRRINPSLLVLENVPGLLSSNRGLDFATVLREVGEGWDCAEVAWRVLDSRYFGVAQRRRRVFVVASAREGCAEQVLALAEGVQWHPAPRDEAREDSPGDAARSPERGGRPTVMETGQANAAICNDHAPSLTCNHEAPIVVGAIDCDIPKQRAQNAAQGHYIAVPIHDKATRHEGQSGKGSGNGLGIGADGDPAPTLTIGDKHAVAVNISNGEPRVSDVVGTLDAARESRGSSQQRFVMQSAFRKSKRAQTVDDDETWVDDGLANTIRADGTQHAVAFNWQNGGGYGNANEGLGITHDGTGPLQRCQTPAVAMEVAPPLTATNDPSRSPQSAEVTNQVASVVRASRGMVVRRLTPTECERLQGFPDGWTQIGTAEKPTADSHRYKQLGNAVTVNVAEWIARRAMKALKGDA